MAYSNPSYPTAWAGSKGIAWIKLEVNKIEKQMTLGRGTGQIELTKTGAEYKFMAPPELMESIQHQWEDYDSMNAKISNLLVGAQTAIGDAINTASAVGRSFWNMMNSKAGGFAEQFSRDSAAITGLKADTPIVYKNSARREYTLEFELVVYSDAYSDVFKPVQELRWYSCPGLKESATAFELPYVFKVTSGSEENPNSNFLYMEVAALVSLQPTFKGPFINGYPSHCNLQLTFREIPPLFRENFTGNPEGYVGSGNNVVGSGGGNSSVISTSVTSGGKTIEAGASGSVADRNQIEKDWTAALTNTG